MTGKDPNVTVNPDEVVALGAAVQAGVLAGGPAALLCWGRVLGVCGRVRLRCCAGGVCFGGVWSGPAALLLGVCPGGRGRVWSGLAALLSWGRVPGGGVRSGLHCWPGCWVWRVAGCAHWRGSVSKTRALAAAAAADPPVSCCVALPIVVCDPCFLPLPSPPQVRCLTLCCWT